MKKLDTSQSDILVLADVPPPPEIEIGLNMNAIGTKIISREVIKYILPIYQLPLSDSMPEQETGEFQFQMDIWTLTPSTTLLQSRKDEMLVFGLCSTSDDWPGWSMDSNPIHHTSPAKKMKCLFLDYIQLLMIGQAGRWTQTPSTTPLQPKI